MATDVLKFDRKTHASYTRYCAWAELFEPLDISALTTAEYFHEEFCFIVDKGQVIYDWTLNASTTDKLFQLATKTQKQKKLKK